MKIFSALIVVVVAAVWIGGAALNFFCARKEKPRTRWLTRLASVLMAVGAAGFFGGAASAFGLLNFLPPTFEWPVGYASGIVSTGDYFYIVPLQWTGRIQIYDSEWRFIRAWPVEANGGSFKLKITDTNHVHVLTARGKNHFTSDIAGELLSAELHAPIDYASFGDPSSTQWVSTSLWLLPFTSPFIAWALCAGGLALLLAARKRAGFDTSPLLPSNPPR